MFWLQDFGLEPFGRSCLLAFIFWLLMASPMGDHVFLVVWDWVHFPAFPSQIEWSSPVQSERWSNPFSLEVSLVRGLAYDSLSSLFCPPFGCRSCKEYFLPSSVCCCFFPSRSANPPTAGADLKLKQALKPVQR